MKVFVVVLEEKHIGVETAVFPTLEAAINDAETTADYYGWVRDHPMSDEVLWTSSLEEENGIIYIVQRTMDISYALEHDELVKLVEQDCRYWRYDHPDGERYVQVDAVVDMFANYLINGIN